jgi:hypothetical protein
MSKERHVLGISGGKDSAALAVYMRQNHPELDIDYFFTDTGKEVPEVYEYLIKLEGFLGKPIQYLNPDRDFDFWLRQFNYFLPSPQTRWCTRQLKLRPFEQWVKPMLESGEKVYSYVAIRADEESRGAYKSSQDDLVIRLPFKEDGIDKEGVYELLEFSNLGLPKYYEWRSRSGCTFCFYQKKIEWVMLLERHKEAFYEAMEYEEMAISRGSPFTWSHGEFLKDIAKPKRITEIVSEHEKKVNDLKNKKKYNPLRYNFAFINIDDIYDQNKSVCLSCQK